MNMMDKIGAAAGQIWTHLSQADGPVGLTEVPKQTQLTSQVAYQALGWLAREGKIAYHTQGRKVTVSLIG